MKSKSEEIRIRYLYRKMIILGKADISLESARSLVGPDCAYHLYSNIKLRKKNKISPENGSWTLMNADLRR